MKRVLFVDDEERILQGLARTLHVLADDWQMTFVATGGNALVELREAKYDVIVTDMRMPQIDGAQLLKQVYLEHPEVVRIVLSGHGELQSTMKAAAIAHQFLTKPCDADTIYHVIERACQLREILNSDGLRSLVGRIEHLPSRPTVYQRLCEAIAHESTTSVELARIVEQDIALTAKLLQLVNSSFFGLAREIRNVEHACAYLGTEMLRNLALSASIFEASSDRIGGLSLDSEQRQAWLTASLARSMIEDRKRRDEAFLAGMLHDVGKLVLARAEPELYENLLSSCSGHSLTADEVATFGASHAEVGGYLLGLWGLEYSVVEAVVHHHQPERLQNPRFDLSTSVYIAAILAEAALSGKDNLAEQLDHAFIQRMGVAHRIDEWSALARARASGKEHA